MTNLDELERDTMNCGIMSKEDALTLIAAIRQLSEALAFSRETRNSEIAFMHRIAAILGCDASELPEHAERIITSLRERDALLREAVERVKDSPVRKGLLGWDLVRRIRAALSATEEAGEKKETAG